MGTFSALQNKYLKWIYIYYNQFLLVKQPKNICEGQLILNLSFPRCTRRNKNDTKEIPEAI